MSYGLRVWDSSGNLKFEITNRLTKLVQTFSVYVPAGSSATVAITAADTSSWMPFGTFTMNGSKAAANVMREGNSVRVFNTSNTAYTVSGVIMGF